jgi:hypothetical protein
MNMSVRPRTPVTHVVPKLRPRWVAFSWEDDTPVLDRDALACLQQHWEALAFTGAAIMHPLDTELTAQVSPHACTDRQLTLNVLLRVRGGLLLGEMPPLDDGEAVVGTAVATDDPRLVRHAGAGQR